MCSFSKEAVLILVYPELKPSLHLIQFIFNPSPNPDQKPDHDRIIRGLNSLCAAPEVLETESPAFPL